MKLFSISQKFPSLRAACGEATQVRRKRANTQVRPYNFQIIFFLLLLTTSTLNSQTINWNESVHPCTAADVNIGSTQCTDIIIYFEVEAADITGGKVVITLPNLNGETFNTVDFPVERLGGVDLGASAVNGRILTFSPVNLPAGSVVYYRIPRYASTQTNSVYTADQIVTVQVYRNQSNIATNGTKNDIKYKYRYATLQLLDPLSMPAGQSSGLQMDFGANNGVHSTTPTVQEFQFRMVCSGGAADSATVSMKFPAYGVTLSDWKVDGSLLDNSQIAIVNTVNQPFTTTYTVKIKKSDFSGGKGIGTGESVPMSVNVLKSSCGTTNVNYTSSWATATTIKTATDISTIGAFNANPGSGFPSQLKVAGNTFTLPDGKFCFDGTSSNKITVALTDPGQGGTGNIELYCYGGRYTIVDTSAVFFRKGYNGNPVKIDGKSMSIPSALGSTDNINPLYRGKPRSARFLLPGASLSPGASDTVYVDVPFSVPADLYGYVQGAERTNTDQFYIYCNIYSHTDICGENTYPSMTNLSFFATSGNFGNISSIDRTLNFSSGETKKISASIQPYLFDKANLPTIITADAKAVLQLTLPQGVELENGAGDVAVYYGSNPASNVFPISNFSLDNTTKADTNIYTFELLRKDRPGGDASNICIFNMDLMLKNTCAVNENRGVQAELRIKLYPTGSDAGGCNDVVFDELTAYSSFSLLCKKEGLSYGFERRRLTAGWRDDDNNSVPDNTQPADPAKINHDFAVTNDTLQFTWKGEVLENDNKVLYAVLLSQYNHTYILPVGDPAVLTLNNSSSNVQAAVKNTKSDDYTLSHDRGTGVPATERYAYAWEITKADETAFTAGDSVIFSVPILGYPDYGNSVVTISMNTWFYASADNIAGGIPGILSPGDARKGREEYPSSSFYCLKPYINNNSFTFAFSSVEEQKREGTAGSVESGDLSSRTPYEYRHFATIDSIVMEIPEGYVMPNTQRFRLITYSSSLTATSTSFDVAASTAHTNLPNRKTFVFGSEIFDVNRNDGSKFLLPDGRYVIYTDSLKISSTYSSSFQATGTITVYADNHSYTQANVPRLGKESSGVNYVRRSSIILTYQDDGSLKALAGGGGIVQEALSATVKWNINLQNTRNYAASSAWLYVQGPVHDVKFIVGTDTVYGEGEGNRWLKLPEIPAGTLPGILSVEYAGTGCANEETVTLYPVYNKDITTQDAWTPADASIAMTDEGYLAAKDDLDKLQYLYLKMALTIRNVASRISGSITALSTTPADPANPTSGIYGSATVAVDSSFPLSIDVSTTGASGPVVDTYIQLNVPTGLKYVAGSAYIEINGVNDPVQPGDFLTELGTLTGDAVEKTLNLDFSKTGISALGNNGELKGNTTAHLRLLLTPTCDVSPLSPRISVKAFGNRACGGVATGSGVGENYSSPLTLTGKIPSFTVDMKNSTIDLTTFNCDNDATLVMRFKKTSGPSEGISYTDSLLIAVPKAINLKAGTDITYDLPAGRNGTTPAQTGQTVLATTVNNRIEGEYRLITWPMPEAYFDALGDNSEGVQTTDNVYTVPLHFAQSTDYFNGDMRVAIVTGSKLGASCPANSAESDAYPIKAVAKATSTTWLGTANNNWANDANWSDGIPGPCTDVVIRSSAAFYPNLTSTTQNLTIDSIHFEADTEIGGVPYLKYGKATADLRILSNQWNLLAAPLQDMYSGDYILSGNRYNPAVYMRKYQSQDYWLGTEKKIAEWTTSFGKTNVPLSPGSGYAVWVATDGSSNIPQTFDFPKDSMSYAVYNLGGTEVIWMEDIPAGGRDKNRKLIYDGILNGSHEFDLPVENGSETAYTNLLIANPFMSHLDFQVFHTANSTKIQNKYYIWGGNSFKAIDDEVVVQNESQRYIAPQQSFVVLRNGNADVSTLHFTPAMSVANSGTTLKRATLERPARLQLKVYKYDKLQSEAEIRYKRGASNSFDESEDAWTLFSNSVKKAAVVYSKIDNAAASINTLGNISEDIPLGIRTSEASELKFVIEGAETFDGEVYLVDAAQGREVNLTENPEYVFQNNTGDIPDRFYIRIREAATSIYKGTATPDIRIYQENGTVHITSAPDDPLRSVEISNVQGQIIAKREGNVSSISISIPPGNQVVVVKAVSERSHAVRKVRV